MLSLFSQLDAIAKTQETLVDYIDKEVTIADLRRLLQCKTSTMVYTLLRRASIKIREIKDSSCRNWITTKILLTKDLVQKLTQQTQEDKNEPTNHKKSESNIEDVGVSFSKMKQLFQEELWDRFHILHFQWAWSKISTKHPKLFIFENDNKNGKTIYTMVRSANQEEVELLLMREYENLFRLEAERIHSRQKKI